MSRLSSGLDPQISRDPTPKKVLCAKSAPMSDRSWQGLKTFFWVGSLLKILVKQPPQVNEHNLFLLLPCLFICFYLRRQLAAGQVMGRVVVVVVVVVLVVKTFTNVFKSQGKIKGSNPEESFIREISTYVRHVLALYVESKLSSGLDP